MAGFNILDFLLGPALAATSYQQTMTKPYYSVQPQAASPAQDTVLSDVGNPPYKSSVDLDDFGRETDEIKNAYLRFYREEPTVKAAVKSKVAAVSCLDVSVKPPGHAKNDPHAKRYAELADYTIRSSPHGWDGLIRNTLLPACLQGYSVQEIVLKHIDREHDREWGGNWGLRYCKSKNTNNLNLQIDSYRNVLGIVNRVRGLGTYPRRKFILFTHDELFDDPFGGADLRAAYRAAQLIDEAFKLWYYAEKVYSGPVVVGKYKSKDTRKAFEAALVTLRQGGVITIPDTDVIELLNMATSINADGRSKLIDKAREDIFLAVRSGFTQFMPGGEQGERHNTAVNKASVGDPDEYLTASMIGRRLSQDLIPAFAINFPPGTPMPIVELGGVNWSETMTQLEAVEKVQKLGAKVSEDYIRQITKIPAPTGPDDVIGGDLAAAGGLPGMPPGAGAPAPPLSDGAPPATLQEPQPVLGPPPPGMKFADFPSPRTR